MFTHFEQQFHKSPHENTHTHTHREIMQCFLSRGLDQVYTSVGVVGEVCGTDGKRKHRRHMARGGGGGGGLRDTMVCVSTRVVEGR